MLKKVYGQKFLEDLAKQQLIIYSAHGGAADAVASGEAWIALEMLVDRIAVQMKKGAPTRPFWVRRPGRSFSPRPFTT